jgi:hypothetical protein
MFLCFYVFRSRACGQGLRSVAQLSLELFTGLVFSVSIGWYFLGILPTNTEGKLGWYISVSKNWPSRNEPLLIK